MDKIYIISFKELRPGNKTLQNYGFWTYGGEFGLEYALDNFHEIISTIEEPELHFWDKDNLEYVKTVSLYEAEDNDGDISNQKLMARYWKDKR